MLKHRFLRLFAFAAILAATLSGIAFAANPNKLWEIVSESCVPWFQAGKGPGLCTEVSPYGYAVLKDIFGHAQYLLIPTTRITGIETPSISQPGAVNYWQAAWGYRSLVSSALRHPLRDDQVGIEVNSADSRTQAQLHLHIDCMNPLIVTQLASHASDTPDTWTRTTLKGHTYYVSRVESGAAVSFNPFERVAHRAAEQQQNMRDHTILMTATKGGFLLVDGTYQPEGPEINPGDAEELLDHSCQIAQPGGR
jgi:CDP-diacylglycerol pyrophosphatase